MEEVKKKEFGINNEVEFVEEIKKGNHQKALEWLKHILNNREKFSFATDKWFADRELELFDSNF